MTTFINQDLPTINQSMTPRRDMLTVAESPRRSRGSAGAARSTPVRQVIIRWRIDARTAARVLELNEADRQPLHGEAQLECRFEIHSERLGDAVFTLRAAGCERTVREIPAAAANTDSNATIIERDGALHVDLIDETGARVLALSMTGDHRIAYVQTPLFDELGIAAGRYDTGSVSITTLPASSRAASTDAA